MSTDVGRGILAPRSGANIRDGAAEMRTLGATAAAAINDTELRISDELATKIGKTEAYENLVPRDEAVRYGIPGPRGKVGPVGPKSDVPGPGGSIALEETDPGCFVDSEITWMQWDNSVGTVARAWNPNTETYHMIFGDTGRRNIRDSHVVQENITAGGRAWIQRTNNTVRLSLYDLNFTSNGSVQILASLPTGFRPIDREGYVLAISNRENREAIVFPSGMHLYQVPEGGGRLRATLSWETADPWPTSLPGIPA